MGEKLPQIVLVGAPNVGKSMIFNYLTGAYVIVSNYPGTTVDISRGKATIGGKVYEVVDTPGIYSLSPLTAEERVTIDILRTSKPALLIHVIDAKNIRRMLPLTLQLLDGGFSLLLVLNIMDEAEEEAEKRAKEAEKNKPKTEEERKEEAVDEALGTDDDKGMLAENMEKLSEITDQMTEEMKKLARL